MEEIRRSATEPGTPVGERLASSSLLQAPPPRVSRRASVRGLRRIAAGFPPAGRRPRWRALNWCSAGRPRKTARAGPRPSSGGAHFILTPAPADWPVEKRTWRRAAQKRGETAMRLSSLLSTTVTTASIWSSGMGASGGGASRWVEPIKDKVLPLIDSAANSYGANTGWPKRTEACDKSS